MRKGINLKERHRHSGKGCEQFPGLNHRQFRTLANSGLHKDLLISAMYVGLVEVKCYEECTHREKKQQSFFNDTEFRSE